jgi:hypothetical protein
LDSGSRLKGVLPNYLPYRRPRRTLSRRDSMSVAWQFTAWKQLEKAFRPVRVRYDRGSTFCSRPQDTDRMPHRTKSYRLYETALSFASFQAVNWQATFIKSLRDKNASCPHGPHSPAIGRRPLFVSSMHYVQLGNTP